MRNPEPLPPLLRNLPTLSARVLIGGALGYACTVAIFATRLYVWGDRVDPSDAPSWPAILEAARSFGVVMGAIYYPLAAVTLLAKENMPRATTTVAIAAIVAGTVGYISGGPGLVATCASIGFWGLCAGIYRRGLRNDAAAGFQSYFR